MYVGVVYSQLTSACLYNQMKSVINYEHYLEKIGKQEKYKSK